MAIKTLTEDMAESRLGWLLGLAGRELERSLHRHADPVALDEADIEDLREISRVASQVAKHYEDRLVRQRKVDAQIAAAQEAVRRRQALLAERPDLARLEGMRGLAQREAQDG